MLGDQEPGCVWLCTGTEGPDSLKDFLGPRQYQLGNW